MGHKPQSACRRTGEKSGFDTRPFLKWPGGKYRLLSRIRNVLHPGKRLVEPFVGSGAVFLNTDYDTYLLADANPDLIGLYSQLLEEGTAFISYCRKFFNGRSNTREAYYAYRDEFNETRRARRKSALFLYLNRHGYNGLCRYNGKGGFNTPFGRYDKPYFPEKEMLAFVRRSHRTKLLQAPFDESMARAQPGDAVYCDPPYVPLSETAHFTDYHAGGFTWDDQVRLADIARELAHNRVQVVISNHDTRQVRELYIGRNAEISRFKVRRNISSDGNNRGEVGELLAVFNPP